MADSQADLAEATSRLERAMNLLEMRVRARLAEELDRARERGRAFEEAAIEASLALSRAASDVRAVLNGEA
jgi:hypothetical protein